MQKYKAIFLDIDGTLTALQTLENRYPLPSKKLIQTIKQYSSKVDFILATSRPLIYAEYLFNIFQLSHPCIVQSGTLVVDPKNSKVLWEKQINEKDLSQLIDYFLEKKLSFVIDEKEKIAIKYDKHYVPHDPLIIFVTDLTDEQASKIEMDLSNISTISLHKVSSLTPPLLGFNIANSEASKQHAIIEVIKMLGIRREETIGVGDGWNDFSLLMACSLKVAMGNAVPELKAIADYIAPSVEDDGVIDIINKFVASK
jgi:hypothetical protein